MKQREIKFRAWDGKRWLTNFDQVLLNEEGGAHVLVSGSATDYLKRVDVTIQFYTGLKDKNGKEIYEGDRVFVDSVDCGRSFYSGIELEISWCEGWSCWGAEYAGELIFMHQMWQPVVVGNIYENAA